MGIKDLIKLEKELKSKPGMNDLLLQLQQDVKSLFRTGAKYGIFVAIPKLRIRKKLNSTMFNQFAADLREFLIISEYDQESYSIPKQSLKTYEQLVKLVNRKATNNTKGLINKNVVIAASNGIFILFNMLTDMNNVAELILVLQEMALVLE